MASEGFAFSQMYEQTSSWLLCVSLCVYRRLLVRAHRLVAALLPDSRPQLMDVQLVPPNDDHLLQQQHTGATVVIAVSLSVHYHCLRMRPPATDVV